MVTMRGSPGYDGSFVGAGGGWRAIFDHDPFAFSHGCNFNQRVQRDTVVERLAHGETEKIVLRRGAIAL